MKITVRQLRSLVSEAAKPVPEYVAAGKFLDDAASQFQVLVNEFSAINVRVNEFISFEEAQTALSKCPVGH